MLSFESSRRGFLLARPKATRTSSSAVEVLSAPATGLDMRQRRAAGKPMAVACASLGGGGPETTSQTPDTGSPLAARKSSRARVGKNDGR